MKEKGIYEKAIETFGQGNQLNMAMEECAELIQAVNKFKRDANLSTLLNLAEEIADVNIMIKQLVIIAENNSSFPFKNEIEKYKSEKLERLSYQIKNSDDMKYFNPIK